MTRATDLLLWSLAATGLCLVLLTCALGFVFLVMWEPTPDGYHPDVRPPAVQPGVPVPDPACIAGTRTYHHCSREGR